MWSTVAQNLLACEFVGIGGFVGVDFKISGRHGRYLAVRRRHERNVTILMQFSPAPDNFSLLRESGSNYIQHFEFVDYITNVIAFYSG